MVQQSLVDFYRSAELMRHYLRISDYGGALSHLKKWIRSQNMESDFLFEFTVISFLKEAGFEGTNLAYLSMYFLSMLEDEDYLRVQKVTLSSDSQLCWQEIAAPYLISSGLLFLGKDSSLYPGPNFPVPEKPFREYLGQAEEIDRVGLPGDLKNFGNKSLLESYRE